MHHLIFINKTDYSPYRIIIVDRDGGDFILRSFNVTDNPFSISHVWSKKTEDLIGI
jgi:hypothetical protein